jgi:nicotinamide-nucleotide amidase
MPHATAAILSIGDELTLGQSVDTNSAWLSAHLVERGIVPIEHATVPDNRPAIAAAITRLASLADLVITTGGLGPTTDDLTREGLADAMGQPLVTDERALAELKEWFNRRGRAMPERNVVQAMRPASARCIPNPNGTAPGLAASLPRGPRSVDIFCLPGPPAEMKPMYEAAVAPTLRARPGWVIVTRSIHTFGLGESDVAARLGDLMDRTRNPLVGTTVHAGIVTCRIRYEGPAESGGAQVHASVNGVEQAIRARVGVYVFGGGEDTPASVALGLLRERGLTLATVESCTGGLVGGALTAVAGSSDVYLGGWVTYANEMKMGEVGVPEAIVSPSGPGAVSREAAEAMARGGLEASGADLCVSVTGIAGPAGGTAEKPVGTVWVAVASKSTGGEGASGTRVNVRRFLFPGSREAVRVLAMNSALAMVRLSVLGEDGVSLLREVR